LVLASRTLAGYGKQICDLGSRARRMLCWLHSRGMRAPRAPAALACRSNMPPQSV